MLEVDRNGLARVLGAAGRLALRHLGLLFGGQVHGRLDTLSAARILPNGGMGVHGDEFGGGLIGKALGSPLSFYGGRARGGGAFLFFRGAVVGPKENHTLLSPRWPEHA